MLDLLENRVRQAGRIGVAAQQQDRQAVGMGEGGGGQQVGGARSGARPWRT